MAIVAVYHHKNGIVKINDEISSKLTPEERRQKHIEFVELLGQLDFAQKVYDREYDLPEPMRKEIIRTWWRYIAKTPGDVYPE